MTYISGRMARGSRTIGQQLSLVGGSAIPHYTNAELAKLGGSRCSGEPEVVVSL